MRATLGDAQLARLLGLALLLAVPTMAAAAENFETFYDRKASEILPDQLRAGPYHRVNEKVVSYGFQHFYTVESDFGAFKAQGDAMLRRLVGEIYAIAAMKEISQSEVFMEATGDAVMKSYEGVKSLITDPVDTISGIPGGIYSLFNRVEDRLDSGKTEYEDSGAKTVLAVSSYKRDFANEFGVDVYSSNPVLQEELNRLGWAGAVGNLTPGTASLAVSGPVVMAISQTRNVQTLNNIVISTPPTELNLRNQKTLEEMGIDAALKDRFLDQKIFSPRHKTVFVESLASMQGAKGRESLIESAVAADSEVSALFFQQIAETMAGYHRSVSPVRAVEILNGLPVAYGQNGSVVIAFPADYARWTERSAPLARHLAANPPNTYPVDKMEIWITGTFSERAKKEFEQLGFSLTQNVDEGLGFVD